MNLIHVIPISRQAFTEELSYFTKEDIPEGTLIQVPLRKKQIAALVVSSEPVKDAKTSIRTSEFQIRKITTAGSKPFLQPAFLHAAKQAAHYYATTESQVLFATIPKHLRDISFPPTPPHTTALNHNPELEPLILQANRSGRIEEYKNIARTSFAKKQSVIILASTIREVEIISDALSKGIGKYLYTFHSGLAKGKTIKSWRAALESDHAIVAVMTAGFLSLPRHDIGTLIIEREGSSNHKQHLRPFIDMRQLAHWYAEYLGATLFRADLPLLVDSLYYYKQQQYDSIRDVPMRVVGGSRVHLTNMCEEKHDQASQFGFSIISEQLLQALQKTHAEGGQSFLFAARRGIAPVTVCNDCGTRVSCLECGAPVILHKVGEQHLFVCHACSATRSAHECCSKCGSWKLQMLGIGIGLVEKELKRLLPDIPVTVFDRDTLTTHRQSIKAMDAFYDGGSEILLGTEIALTYLDKPVKTSGIVSLDSLLSIPEWNVYERIMSIVLRTREVTEQELFVQTRKPDEDVVNQAVKGDLGSFYKAELADRKAFNYPPFSTLIKISCEGTAEHARKTQGTLKQVLEPFGFTAVPHMMRSPKGKYMMHGFLRLKKGEWPNESLRELFMTFPADVRVEVDPGSIL